MDLDNQFLLIQTSTNVYCLKLGGFDKPDYLLSLEGYKAPWAEFLRSLLTLKRSNRLRPYCLLYLSEKLAGILYRYAKTLYRALGLMTVEGKVPCHWLRGHVPQDLLPLIHTSALPFALGLPKGESTV